MGAATCDAPYVAADRLERAVVGAVLDRVLTVENFQRLLTKIRAALADPAVADELRRLEGEMSRLRRLVGNLLDAIEEGGGRDIKERLKARGDELARLQTQHAELQQRQTLAAFELADGELADVLAAMRADVQSDETPVARRALSLFVRRVDVDADRLVIWYHEPDLVECTRLQTVPPRGFRLKTSMTGGQPYWPEVWATPALAPALRFDASAGASVAAAWRGQLGDGEAGVGRLPRGRLRPATWIGG